MRIAYAVASFALLAFIGLGIWVYQNNVERQRLEPLRRAVALAKSGQSIEAIPILENFANQGDAPTMLVLADLYAYGVGIPYDERRAALWARAASSTGILNADASFEDGVARSYDSGIRGTADHERAKAWFTRAAEAGNRHSQEVLADKGNKLSLSADPSVAAYWKAFLAKKQKSPISR